MIPQSQGFPTSVKIWLKGNFNGHQKRTMNKYILTATLFFSLNLSAQDSLVMLRSSAKFITYTIEGKRGSWNIGPEAKAGGLEVPVGGQQISRITLETEVDTVSYTIRRNQKINLIVLVNYTNYFN